MTNLITDEMRKRQSELIEKLKKQHPNAVIDVWWDFDSLFTPDPKMKQKIVEKNGGAA